MTVADREHKNNMSSNLEIKKICQLCGNEFVAKTTVTRYCSHKCASRAYKQRKRESKVQKAVEETTKQKTFIATGIDLNTIRQKDFLSIKEAYTVLGVSESTFYRLMKSGTVPATKVGGRTIIKRSEIDKLFI